jgi:hypothetical protein
MNLKLMCTPGARRGSPMARSALAPRSPRTTPPFSSTVPRCAHAALPPACPPRASAPALWMATSARQWPPAARRRGTCSVRTRRGTTLAGAYSCVRAIKCLLSALCLRHLPRAGRRPLAAAGGRPRAWGAAPRAIARRREPLRPVALRGARAGRPPNELFLVTRPPTLSAANAETRAYVDSKVRSCFVLT